MGFILEDLKTYWDKVENADYQRFLLSSSCFKGLPTHGRKISGLFGRGLRKGMDFQLFV